MSSLSQQKMFPQTRRRVSKFFVLKHMQLRSKQQCVLYWDGMELQVLEVSGVL